MQGQMGRIAIPPERLRQWKITALQLAKVIAGLIGIECKAEEIATAGAISVSAWSRERMEGIVCH